MGEWNVKLSLGLERERENGEAPQNFEILNSDLSALHQHNRMFSDGPGHGPGLSLSHIASYQVRLLIICKFASIQNYLTFVISNYQ